MAIAGAFRMVHAAALLVGLSAVAAAQPPRDRIPVPHVRVSAEATVTAKPDQAKVNIGVVSQAKTAREAAVENAKQLDEVLVALRRVLGKDADIKTVSYSLYPEQNMPRDGGQPVITGYRAANTVQVTMNNLDTVGPVIDAATGAGANNIQGIQFTLRDEEAVRAQALREATRKARAGAEAIAAALGEKITKILSVEEGQSTPIRPVMAMAASRMSPTPVEAGTIEVHATVTLTAEVSE